MIQRFRLSEELRLRIKAIAAKYPDPGLDWSNGSDRLCYLECVKPRVRVKAGSRILPSS